MKPKDFPGHCRVLSFLLLAWSAVGSGAQTRGGAMFPEISRPRVVNGELRFEVDAATANQGCQVEFTEALNRGFRPVAAGRPGQREIRLPVPSLAVGFFRVVRFEDPLLTDWDDDGITNADESVLGTDPFNADSDRDGWADGADADPRRPAVGALLLYDPTDRTPPRVSVVFPEGVKLWP